MNLRGCEIATDTGSRVVFMRSSWVPQSTRQDVTTAADRRPLGSRPLFDSVNQLPPRHAQLPSRCGAVAEVEVDEALVGHALFLGQRLEIADGLQAQPDRDGLLEPARVGVAAALHVREVVFFS